MCPVFTNTTNVSSTDLSILCGIVEGQAALTTTILAASESLTVTKIGTPSEVCAGGVVTYQLVVRNTSAAPKTFTLKDTMIASDFGLILPGDVSTNPAATSITNLTDGLEIVWENVNIPGKYPPNDYYEQTYTITLSTNCDMVPSITNNAEIDFSGSTIPSNTVTTLVKAVVDLSIEKIKLSPADPVYVDDTIEYQINVTNNGPCYASGVYVEDTLPPNAMIVPDPNWVLVSGTTYRYAIGGLSVGTTIIYLKVIPTAPTNP